MRYESASSALLPRRVAFLAAGVAMLTLLALCGGFFYFLNAARNHPPPPIIGQNCGVVGVRDDLGYTIGNQAALDCLWHAYQPSCKTATLKVNYFGVDTSTEHALTVQPQHNTCAVTDASQFYFASGGGSTGAVVDHTCGGLLQQRGGLVAYACGDDANLIMPHLSATIYGPGVPPPTNADAYALSSCGSLVLYAGHSRPIAEQDTKDDATAPITCFATNWTTTCAPQHLRFVQFTVQSVMQETFGISIQHTAPCQRMLTLTTQSRTLTTPPSDIAVVTCTGLAQRPSGLIISGCGTRPPIVIPTPSGVDGLANPSPPQVGQVCQNNGNGDTYGACFWRAYQACQPVTITGFWNGDPALVIETVTAQPLHGHCTLTAILQFAYPYNAATLAVSAVTASCASAQQHDNEIVVSGCGALGDLIFP